ncbi:uromodulin-like [Dendronephthya gigantea]|uniref:uromodulin-like n=1 Tax=Dendronephthya gigantea TaxID=151771 RepID=UPI00106C4AB6|nr:uromodulin-like [Dendronephthya gigantea]
MYGRFVPNLALYFVFFTSNNYGSGRDKCNSHNYTVINDSRRSITNMAKPEDGLLCDRNAIDESTWYRFKINTSAIVGDQLATTKPPLSRCGTFSPIWMNGSHPTAAEGVVLRKACAYLPYAAPLGCAKSYEIKVLNCSGFYVYQLKPPKQCYLAYCVASNYKPTISPKTTLPPVTTLPSTTTLLPTTTLPPDFNECVQTVGKCHPNATCSNDTGSFSCKCLSGYDGDGKLVCTG